MNCAAYIRVSSRAQDHATQRNAIERACLARGDVVTEWFAEKRSAKTTERPELERLRAEARAGSFARLYVFRLDRLARTGIRDTLEILDELKRAGVQVVNLADGFDAAGPFAEVIIAVIAWAAQMELLAMKERISAARERLAEAGRPWGRRRRLSSEDVDAVKLMHEEGRSVREIAVALKIPRSTIGRALLLSQNPAPIEGADLPEEMKAQGGASR